MSPVSMSRGRRLLRRCLVGVVMLNFMIVDVGAIVADELIAANLFEVAVFIVAVVRKMC